MSVTAVSLPQQYSRMVPRTTAITNITKQRTPKVTARGRQQGDAAHIPEEPEGADIE